jgi:hypothetical protein
MCLGSPLSLFPSSSSSSHLLLDHCVTPFLLSFVSSLFLFFSFQPPSCPVSLSLFLSLSLSLSLSYHNQPWSFPACSLLPILIPFSFASRSDGKKLHLTVTLSTDCEDRWRFESCNVAPEIDQRGQGSRKLGWELERRGPASLADWVSKRAHRFFKELEREIMSKIK